MQAKVNVVPFRKTQDLHVVAHPNVWASIEVYLNRRGQNSINTRKTYERAYRNFFQAMRGKELEDLNVSDLQFTKAEVEGYQVALRDSFKASTVNNRIFALKSLYEKLKDYGFPVEPSWFKLDKYEEHDKEPSDPMTHAEVVESIKLVLGTRQGKQKALLLRLAYATAFRKESLLEMKKTDIFQRNGVWMVRVLGKGNKWDSKKISNDLYDELMERISEIKKEKIFTLNKDSVTEMMSLITSSINFGERKITFHSLKKSSIEEVGIITNNDLKAMQNHGNHKSSHTTVNNYLANKKLDDLVVVDINYHVPVEAFDELSRDELLQLLKRADRTTQIRLLQTLGVI